MSSESGLPTPTPGAKAASAAPSSSTNAPSTTATTSTSTAPAPAPAPATTTTTSSSPPSSTVAAATASHPTDVFPESEAQILHAEPGASWNNRQAQEEYRRAMEFVLDKDFNLNKFGDPFDDRDMEIHT
ncbi:hypothetical protein PRK78_006205 [Emydomyces testavorans]|uniref:Uncharacterized protein n=1 Tax=Emydomyces testavorans TaxID=2070801 RepID=A0AAF0IKN1_9EURO|nr:hypothetical protein PRK78_006205 [Emydomyces testavorans]